MHPFLVNLGKVPGATRPLTIRSRFDPSTNKLWLGKSLAHQHSQSFLNLEYLYTQTEYGHSYLYRARKLCRFLIGPRGLGYRDGLTTVNKETLLLVNWQQKYMQSRIFREKLL